MPGTPKIIDLFSGVGGFTLGAARAGFRISGAVELDARTILAHAHNFPAAAHVHRDIGELSGAELLDAIDCKPGEIDGVVGGPPCQGFSTIGQRCSDDPRNGLLADFFRLVSELTPRFFVAENVPGVLAVRNESALKRALSLIPARYTILPPMIAKADQYGAATTRTRVFFVGYDARYVCRLTPNDLLPQKKQDVRVRDALALLPAIRSAWGAPDQAWRAVGVLPPSEFNLRVTGLIPPGVGDPEVIDLYRRMRVVSGCMGTVHTPETIKRFRGVKPGDIDPVSKGRRLEKNGYCPTLRAGTGPERGSYQAVRPIHPSSNRVITPREAARLQGFPDWYQFDKTKWHSFRQIGNSVSPLVAECIMRHIRWAIS